MILSAVVGATLTAHAQTAKKPEADRQVAKTLKEIGYKYVVTPLGNYRVHFNLDDGRAHLVFISSRTEKFGALRTRKIWATVAKSGKLLSQDGANRLLMDNVPQIAGAYELTKDDDGGYKILYAARVESDCSASTLREVVRLVLLIADAKEKELTNADEF